MIAKLKGRIDAVFETSMIVDVNGVGYAVFASANSLRKMGAVGNEVSVLIETHVREDHIHLYGFADALEKEWFQILCTVQGVGTKVALAILSVATPADLMLAIAAGDKAVVQQADGVGPKLATRIVTELKEKAGKLSLAGAGQAVPVLGNAGAAVKGSSSLANDAVSALVNLGYGQSEAFKTVHQILANDDTYDLGLIIREGLKALSSGGRNG